MLERRVVVQGWTTLLVLVFLSFAPAVSEAKRNVYVTHFSSGNVAAFDIAGNGALTPLAGSPFASGPTGLGEAPSPDGRHLFVANASGPSVSVFDVAADGSLSHITGSPFADPGGPTGVAASPDGNHVFVANQLTANVAAFDVAADGSLTPVAGSPFPAGNHPYGVAVTPDGKHVYVGNRNSGDISAFDVAADGSLTPVAGSPFASGTVTYGITPSPDGEHLYAGNLGSGTVAAFTIAADGSLTPVAGSPFASPGAIGVTPAPDGKRLFVAGGSDVSVFDIAADGSLAPVTGSPFANSNGRNVAAAPDGNRIFVSNATATVSAFDVAADGALSPVAGSPFATGGTNPDFQSVTVTPNQPPVASFTASGLKTGGPVTFDAGASTDSDGTIARYDWDFGDGTTLADGGPTPSHTYATPGTYQAEVTLTDNEGCSTARIYTGQTAACNGSAIAAQTTATQVTDGVPPDTLIDVNTAVTKGPHHATHKRRVKLKFHADEPGSSFECALKGPDGAQGPKSGFAPCKKPKRYGGLEPGRYRFRVRALDAAGNIDKTPAKFEFTLRG